MSDIESEIIETIVTSHDDCEVEEIKEVVTVTEDEDGNCEINETNEVVVVTEESSEVVVIEEEILTVIEEGSQGPIGPQGPAGPQGEQGPQGPAGPETGVSSINSLLGNIVIDAGSNVAIEDDGNGTITISSTGGGAVDSVNGETGVVVLDTDDVAEGATNLYYTDGRAQAANTGLYVGLTGNESIADVKTFTDFPVLPSGTAIGNQAVTANQLAEAVSVEKFRRGFVIDVLINTPPGSPTAGDRYVVGESPTGDWVGHADAIAEWTGSAWTFLTAEEGFTVTVESTFVDYSYNDLSTWVPSGGNTIYSASNGVLLTGSNFEIDFANTNPALEIADGGLRAKVDDTSIERTTNGLSVKNVAAAKITGQVSPAQGGTGLSALGSANRVLGVNAAGSAMEYKNVVGGANVSVINTAGQIEISSSLSGAADFFYTSESFYADPGVNFVWTNLPAALTIGSTYLRKKVNLTGATQFRIVVNQAVAGASLSKLRVQYSPDNVNFFQFDADTSGDLAVGAGTGVKVGAWTDIVAGAKSDVWLQFYALGGDGVVDPAFRQIDVQLRYNSTIVDGDSTGVVAREIPIISSPATNVVWTNMPAALTEFLGATYSRQQVDLTGCTHYRLVVNQAVAGFAGADINLQYSTVSQSTGYVAADTGGVGELDIGTGVGVKVGAWAPLQRSAQGDVWIRLVGKSGDGIADPAFRQVLVQFKSTVLAQPASSGLTAIAGENISAYRVVYVNPSDGKLYVASSLDTSNRFTIAGMTTSAVTSGDEVTIQTRGSLFNSGWSWNLASPHALYLVASGQISQTAPTSGFVCQVGFVTATNEMFLDIGEKILLI